MKQFRKQNKLITLVALSLFGSIILIWYCFFVLGWDGLTTSQERNYWRQKTLNTHADLSLVMSREQVKKVLTKRDWPTKLTSWESSKLLLKTPTEFGATNWWLLVEFQKDKVVSVKIRSEDSLDYLPAKAPKDKVKK